MQKSDGITLGRLARSAGGSEIAEFAMILPMLFLLLIGVFWFGQAFRIYGTITNAARDGARAAVAPACATCAGVDPTATAWTVIQNDLQAAHINPSVLRQPTTPPTLCTCAPGAGAAVCTTPPALCDSTQTNICVQGVTHTGANNLVTETLVQLSSTVQPTGSNLPGGAGECGISVSFQYPYTFWLPFTSLDKQTVNLRAQAQMRAEIQ
ncbi:MAG: TadE family protein [Candidatus Sulfotelmatobacter sp.]